MAKIKDYECKYASYNRLTPEVVAPLGLKIPDLYCKAEDLAKVAVHIKKENGYQYCSLPYDTAVHAENLGAPIQYDESPLGPRKAEDLLDEPLEFLNLPPLDPSKGRLSEILRACTLLKDQGEIPVLEIRGLFDVMNSLIDIPKVIMALTRKGEIEQIAEKMRKDIITYFKAAEEAGCTFFMYSDASAGVSLIGPRFSKKVAESFTLPLIKEWMEVMGDQCVLQVCPKTSFLLTGLDMAEWKYKTTDKDKTYFEAYLSDPEIRLTGQRCSREISHSSGGRINYLELV